MMYLTIIIMKNIEAVSFFFFFTITNNLISILIYLYSQAPTFISTEGI